MSGRVERLQAGLAALDRGDLVELRELFTADARWLGVPGTGFDGATPT